MEPFAAMLTAIREAYSQVYGPYPFPVHIVVTLQDGSKQEHQFHAQHQQTPSEAILEALDGKTMKRAVLARAVGLSERQVQRYCSELIKEGLVAMDKDNGYCRPSDSMGET